VSNFRISICAVTIIAAFFCSSLISPARADTAYLIHNVKSGRCLDATDSDPGGNNPNSLPNGTPIQLWDCWGWADAAVGLPC
jgi:hypothetical protein